MQVEVNNINSADGRDFLGQILEVKKEEATALRKKFKRSDFGDSEFFSAKSLSFKENVLRNNNLSVIAEIKKSSPSKGLIRKDFDHIEIANTYFKSNIQAISILTDKNFFRGNISFLRDIAKIKKAPLLRKDFIIDEFQVLDAKANGADIILLICEALNKSSIKELSLAAHEAGLEVLLELHSEAQLDKIDFDINKIIGINNRNLVNFEVDLNTTADLAKRIPGDAILVAESGIRTKEDVDFLKKAGARALLVGEHFMRSEDINKEIETMLAWCRNEG